jgi:flagellar FliL protein
MADKKRQKAARSGRSRCQAKGKLKLIIAVVGVLAIVGGGARAGSSFFRHHGEEAHAEAPPPKPPSFVEVPDMLVNLVGNPGERVQYLKVKVVLEVKEEKQVEAIKPNLPRVTDIFQTYLRELRASDSTVGRPVSPQGRADQARQCGGRAERGQRGAVQGNRRSVTRRI